MHRQGNPAGAHGVRAHRGRPGWPSFSPCRSGSSPASLQRSRLGALHPDEVVRLLKERLIKLDYQIAAARAGLEKTYETVPQLFLVEGESPLLPLTFLSSAFMAPALMPSWMRHIADVNPVNWAIVAGRSALAENPDWGVVASRGGALLAVAIAAVWLSVRTFRSYQRSV